MTNHLIPRRALAMACMVVAASASASAATAQGVTGDWNGKREAWARSGVELDLGYTLEAAWNTSGGTRRQGARAGQLAAAGAFDLERLWGWPGTRAQVSLSLHDGDNLASRAGLGTLFQVQEVYGRGNIARLGSLWLGKQSADGRFDFKAGRLAVGEDFNAVDCIAMNLVLCGGQPALFDGDYWFNHPLSQWGGVVTYRPVAGLHVSAGAYQVNPRYADTRGGGLRLAPAGTVGTLSPLELVWAPSLAGLSGRYALGGWYSSAPRPDATHALAAEGLPQRMRSGAYGGWVNLQQQLTRGSGAHAQSGLRGHLAFAQGDPRTGSIDQMLNLQLIHTGIGARRPDDRAGIGLATTRVNPRAARPGQQREQVAEVLYGWKPLQGVDLQPGVQYVRHPGGFSARKDAVVVGLKMDVRF